MQLKGFLIDMDGTLYIGPRASTGAVAFMNQLAASGLRRVVLTNNSSRSGARYVERLTALGMPVRPEEVLTSGEAAAAWLQGHTALRRPYILGTQALADAAGAAGLTPTPFEGEPDCVLLGYDLDLTYARLTEAALLIAGGLPYYATHADLTCIDPRGLLPDAGALIAALEATTTRRPIILGKPTTSMLEAGLGRLGLSRGEVMIIGDQLDTDIPLGLNHGVRCALVLSGETSAARLADSGLRPDWVCAHVGEVHQRLIEEGVLGGG
ncbi:HAD-IIA family hydrolase, partial [Myxococcota bacterium]|nr:HAD-IIA family hydrolase [Myxococcota bacterium]MBU1431819.1 HAD-IIA family hydrolase [Myxococcota bacterium]MBU1898989.1 HAD-IIA family hydrolase [Myxococcota bacterium]